MADIQIIERQPEALQVPQGLADMVEAFLRDQDVRENSRSLYRRTLRRFFCWVEEAGLPFSGLAREHVLRYKEHLLSSGMSSLTTSSYLTVVRKFFTWTEANKIYPNIAKSVKSPARKQQFKKPEPHPRTIEEPSLPR